jgi:hypothetical protein
VNDVRRRDLRQKILLGALVVRAGLAEADRAFLLGALLEASRIAAGTDQHEQLKAIGLEAFKRQPADQLSAPDPDPGDEP